mgnify:CR=1 FL=1
MSSTALAAKVERVLYHHDQPILDVLRSKDGGRILAIVVVDGEDPTWLAARVSRQIMDKFIASKIACRDMFLKHRIGDWLTGSFLGEAGDTVELVPFKGEVEESMLPRPGARLRL